MANIIKPIETIINAKGYKIFLAGSIDQGTAIDWQVYIERTINDMIIRMAEWRISDEKKNYDVTIFNPRCDIWDAKLEQNKDNKRFREQVEWELNALDKADLIMFYFDPKSKSPVSLLELGLYAQSGKVICCCPKGYWRKGNVDIVCERYNIKCYADLDEMITYCSKFLI